MTVFSFKSGFVFVANTRTASSTIHHLLVPDGDVIFYRPSFGKHFTFPQIARRARAMVGCEIDALFTFGVVREPISWLYSWYKFRKRDALKRSAAAERVNAIPDDVSFSGFVEEASGTCPPPFARIPPQSRYFRDDRGRIRVRFIAPYDKLADSMRAISALPPLRSLAEISDFWTNSSPEDGNIPTEPSGDAATSRCKVSFAADYDLYERAVRGDHGRIPSKLGRIEQRIALDAQERREDLMSRISLYFDLDKLEIAAALMEEMDDEGLRDERMRWIADRLRSAKNAAPFLKKIGRQLGGISWR
jgi:hypothetical protein